MTQPSAAPVLRTERLVLRPLSLEDAGPLVEMWSDPRTTRFIGGEPRSENETWMKLLAGVGLWPLLGYGYWTFEADGVFIGQGGLADFHRPTTPKLTLPEAGWSFAPDHWGKGYATEAVRAICGWADSALDLPATCCIIDPGNEASIRVAEKCGFAFDRLIDFNGEDTQLFLRPRHPANSAFVHAETG